MNEKMNVKNLINKFNKCITHLLSADIEVDKKDPPIILLASLLKSYKRVVIILLIGKMTLVMNEVPTTFLETENIKQPSSLSHIGQTLVMNSKSHHGRSKSRGRYYDVLNHTFEGI